MDHKPTGEREHSRITRAGGYVEYSRVNGNLALSRALGDYGYKTNTKLQPEEQVVTANPDVEVRKLSNDYEFILIACDGIWDVLTSQVCCNNSMKLKGSLSPLETKVMGSNAM